MDFNDFKGIAVSKEALTGNWLSLNGDIGLVYIKTINEVNLFSRQLLNPNNPLSTSVSYITQGLNPKHKEAYHICTLDYSDTLLTQIEEYLKTVPPVPLIKDTEKTKKASKLYKLKDETLKPVITDTPMHFTNLNFLIENIGLPPEELNTILASSIAHAKETKTPVLLSYAGNYDLLVTESRIHVIQMFKTFEHPEIEEQ